MAYANGRLPIHAKTGREWGPSGTDWGARSIIQEQACGKLSDQQSPSQTCVDLAVLSAISMKTAVKDFICKHKLAGSAVIHLCCDHRSHDRLGRNCFDSRPAPFAVGH